MTPHRRREALAPSSHRGCAVARLALLALALSACGPPPVEMDAGDVDAGGDAPIGGGGSARVVVPREPFGTDLGIDSFVIDVDVLRLVSDRGEAFDPVRRDVGSVDIATPQGIDLVDLPPASYSAVYLGLNGFDLRFTDTELGPVHVAATSEIDWMARCPSAAPVRVGERLSMGVTMELDGPLELLRASALPAPTGGVIEVTDTTAPEALHELLEHVARVLRAECETSPETGGS